MKLNGSFLLQVSDALRRAALSALLAPVLLASPLRAQETGTVEGTVTDASTGGFSANATVRIQGTSIETTTDRQGAFTLPNVPVGEQKVVVESFGSESTTESVSVVADQRARVDISLTREDEDLVVLAEFTVASVRLGQSKAITEQRAASSLKNIISSDAIGNLPDRTVGEALGRLPGVNVVDDSYASIRGTAAEFNAVTLDGDRFTTSGDSADSTQVQSDNRAVDLSLIPAEMVGGIEVIKTLTPDMDADSFGGTINLVTRSAFELKERSINGKVEYIMNDYKNNNGYAASFTYMDVLNKDRTVGLSATFTYRDEDKNTDSYEFTYYDAGAIPIGSSGSGTAGSIAAVGDQGLQDYDTRLNFQSDTKMGVTVNLDWKVSDNTELHFRTFKESSERQGGRFRNRARSLSRWDANSTAESQRGSQVRLQKILEDADREQDVLRLGVEGTTKLGGGELNYGVRYGDSTLNVDRERYTFDFRSNTQRRAYSWTMDRSDPKLPVFTMTHIATGQDGLFFDLADLGLSAIRFHEGEDNESDLTGNLDYEFAQMAGTRQITWKLGTKYRTKDRSSRPSIQDFSPPSAAVPNFSQFIPVYEPRDLIQGSQTTMGPYVSLEDVLAYYYANQGAFTPASGDEITRLEARKYDVSEDIVAAYAMASTKFDKLEIIAGLRWEQTQTEYLWLADPNGPSSGNQDYDDIYPSLLFNYRFTPDLVARLAWTNTLSRPNYGDLVPYRVLADTQEESGTGGAEPGDYPETNKVYLGNSELGAQSSQNFDLSLEYYIEPAGVVSVALFRKDLEDVIYRSQFTDPATPNTIYFQDRNGGTGQVEGIELAWQQAFTFLPGPLSGFGVNINATFIDGSAELEELVPGTSDTYQTYKVDFLPEQPETVYNVQLWWEKYGFTARVALNYVDEFVRTSGGLTSFSVNDTARRWDASLSYRLTEHFIIYLEGKNLTEEVTSWYATTPNRPEDYEFTGRTVNGGVKFRF